MLDHNVVSWDGNSLNDSNYTSVLLDGVGLPAVSANAVERVGAHPIFSGIGRSGRRLTVDIAIEGSNVTSLISQLKRWFDPEDETPKQLVIEDDDGTADRYVEAVCESLAPRPNTGGMIWSATLSVDGDVRWRETSLTSSSWTITASGQTTAVTNNGTDKAFPVFTIEPTAAKTGSQAYRAWLPIRWPYATSWEKFPMDIVNASWDMAALTPSKAQADGDDVRVKVDGIEVDRWFGDIDTANTSVWVNLDFQAKQEGTLESAIAGSGAIDTIDVNEDVSGFPGSGIVIVGSEAFVYTGKNNSLRRFTGVTRAVRGTSMAAHSAGDTLWWCQHDIWLLYGNPSATAPTQDDNYRPAFDLDDSTNLSWVYDGLFGEDDGLRTGGWIHRVWTYDPEPYTGNRESYANPWEVVGGRGYHAGGEAYWHIVHPSTIDTVSMTGERYCDITGFVHHIVASSLTGGLTGSTPEDVLYSIPGPTVVDTWESWTTGGAVSAPAGRHYVGLDYVTSRVQAVEVETATVTFDEAPTVTIGAEQGNYELDVTLENVTTGDAIQLQYTMSVNGELEADTDEKTITDLDEGSSQFQALTLVGGARRYWLALDPGSNTLQWTEPGLAGVSVDIEWRERHH